MEGESLDEALEALEEKGLIWRKLEHRNGRWQWVWRPTEEAYEVECHVVPSGSA